MKTHNSKCWWRCGVIRSPIHGWWAQLRRELKKNEGTHHKKRGTTVLKTARLIIALNWKQPHVYQEKNEETKCGAQNQTLTQRDDMAQFQKYYIEPKEADTKDYTQCDSIRMNFKNRQEQRMVIRASTVLRRVEAPTGKGHGRLISPGGPCGCTHKENVTELYSQDPCAPP